MDQHAGENVKETFIPPRRILSVSGLIRVPSLLPNRFLESILRRPRPSSASPLTMRPSRTTHRSSPGALPSPLATTQSACSCSKLGEFCPKRLGAPATELGTRSPPSVHDLARSPHTSLLARSLHTSPAHIPRPWRHAAPASRPSVVSLPPLTSLHTSLHPCLLTFPPARDPSRCPLPPAGGSLRHSGARPAPAGAAAR